MNLALVDGADPVELDLSDYPDRGDLGQTLVLQNLGPGDVYFDALDDLTSSTGVMLALDERHELRFTGKRHVVFLIADTGDADLRYALVD